jgi:2-iminobutanoate/2-iminopropanoate deaminase
MSERTIVSTDGAPAAIGPYSQGVIGAGLVHCSGQIAMDPATGEVIGDDAATQAEGALKNLQAVLEAAGSSLDKVLKCNVYIIDMGEFAAINEVYGRFFTGDSPPARACVEVSGLPKGALFEIDCVALA